MTETVYTGYLVMTFPVADGKVFLLPERQEKMKMTIGFIGAGMTGTALATRLWQRGYPVVAVSSRSLSSAKRLASFVSGCTVCDGPQQVADIASVVFITTPDDVIADIAAGIRWRPGQVAVHCSGVHSTDILEPAGRYGAHACCLHPLQTFAGMLVAWCIRGSALAAIPWSWITNPLTTLPMWYGCYRLGAVILPGRDVVTWDGLRAILAQLESMRLLDAVLHGVDTTTGQSAKPCRSARPRRYRDAGQ